MSVSNFEIIRQAINERRPIAAIYKGLARELCPHVLGWKNGREQTLCYQSGGESKSGLDPIGSPSNWRCVFVDELEDVRLIDGEFATAANHSRPQTCVDRIAVEVKFSAGQAAS